MWKWYVRSLTEFQFMSCFSPMILLLCKEILFFSIMIPPWQIHLGCYSVFVIFFRCLQIINLAILRIEIINQLFTFFAFLGLGTTFVHFSILWHPTCSTQVPKGNLCCFLSLLSQFIEYFRMQSRWLENICLVLSNLISLRGWDLAVTGFSCKQVASTAAFSSVNWCKKCCLLARRNDLMEN